MIIVNPRTQTFSVKRNGLEIAESKIFRWRPSMVYLESENSVMVIGADKDNVNTKEGETVDLYHIGENRWQTMTQRLSAF